MDTSVWWSGDLFSAMRTTLGADRSREHLEAHVKGDTVTALSLRAEHVVDWATRGGARALGRDDLGRLSPGAKADVVLIKNDDSPVSFPIVNPYGHVAFQAQRGDVHTVIVDGKVVKDAGRLVGFDAAASRRAIDATIEHLRSSMGDQTWQAGMQPALPEGSKVLDNPYQYTDYQSESTHGARGSMFGEPGSEEGSEHGSEPGPSPGPVRRAASMAGRGSGPDFVESLARGLDVLRCFDASHRSMSLADVATATGLARPTARRLLLTLQELGYVRSCDGAFSSTPKVITLGTAYAASLGLWEVARPHLEALVRQTGESSSMAQLDGSDIVYVARVSVPKIIALRVEIGTLFPAPVTSQGKVLLAALTSAELDAVLAIPSRSGVAPVEHPPTSAVTSGVTGSSGSAETTRQRLDRELTQVRARGWALADEELAPGVRSVAVPVRDGSGTVRAAMNVTVHAAETSTETLLDQHLPRLLRAASDVSNDWALWQSRPHHELAAEQ